MNDFFENKQKPKIKDKVLEDIVISHDEELMKKNLEDVQVLRKKTMEVDKDGKKEKNTKVLYEVIDDLGDIQYLCAKYKFKFVDGEYKLDVDEIAKSKFKDKSM